MTKTELFTRVRANWNELFAKEVSEKIIWQKVSVGMFILTLLLIIGLIKVSSKSNIVPWIVEVDTAGRAIAVGPATLIETADERIIKAHLFNFVEISRTVIGDPEAMRRNLNRVYELVSPPVRNFLNDYYRDNNPLEAARRSSKEVVVLSFLKESDKTFIVEWREIVRDLSNKVIEESRYKGLFIISQPSNQKTIENYNNPFGIVVNNISWSKVM